MSDDSHLALVVGTQINFDGNDLPVSQATVDLREGERDSLSVTVVPTQSTKLTESLKL